MRINGIIISTAFVFLFAVCNHPAPVETRKLLSSNPTSYQFDLSPETMQDTLKKIFSVEQQMDDTGLVKFFSSEIDMNGSRYKRQAIFHPENSEEPVFGKSYFQKPGTAGDVFLTSMGEYWLSPVYTSNGKPLKVNTNFLVHLKAVGGNKTLLVIEAENPFVFNNNSTFDFRKPNDKMVYVKPTTIEEYILIRYIASKLGQANLPAVKMP